MKLIQPMIVEYKGFRCEVKKSKDDENCCNLCDFSEKCDMTKCLEMLGSNNYLKKI